MNNKQRRIVFVNQSTTFLTIDIVNAFLEHFDSVSLITGSIREQDIPLNKDIQVVKISPYRRNSKPAKVVSWLIATIQIGWFVLTKFRKTEIVFVTNPLSRFSGVLYPEISFQFWFLIFILMQLKQTVSVKETGFIVCGLVITNLLFSKAYRIYTIGSTMAKKLKQYASESKIVVIPNWAGLTQAKRINKAQNPFAHKHNLVNKFVVLYSGNMGVTHNVEVLLEVAEKLKSNLNIVLLFIGRGYKANIIGEKIANKQLDNCMMLPFQPDKDLLYSLAIADLGVVLLDNKAEGASIPSKTYNLQAVGAPLLCIAETNSELQYHINHFNNGAFFTDKETDKIANWIYSVYSNADLHQKLVTNSLAAAEFFTNKNAEKYVETYLHSAPSPPE